MPSTLSMLRPHKAKRQPHYTDSLESLQAEFRRRGWHRRATGRLLSEFAVVVALAVVGYAAFLLAPFWPLQLLGLLVSTYGCLAISTQAHTASHGTVSRKRWFNRLLTYLGYPLLLGLPTTWWRHKHIVVHHRAPNVDGHDEDIQLMPLFALTEDEAQRGGRLARFYHRYIQVLLVPIALGLIAFNTLAYGWAYVANKLIRRRKSRAAYWLDVVAGLGHLALWIGVPALFFPIGLVLLAYGLRAVLLGYGMFAVFAPAHFPAEAVIADNSQREADYALRQTATTINFRTGPIGRFLCAGVDFQIEHHLFANFSHVYYAQMSPLVREFCERHGYPYCTLGWGEGILKSLIAFARPRPIVQELSREAA